MTAFDSVEIFGLFAISVMVISYAFEERHHLAVAIFALGCTGAAFYAFLIQSYPFMIAEGIWALIALRRWQITTSAPRAQKKAA